MNGAMEVDASLLLSIHPHHVARILSGRKTAELRRQQPRVRPGDPVFVYASSPEKRLILTFRVDEVVTAPPTTLWRRAGERAAVPKKQFFAYFGGLAVGTAILFSDARVLQRPVDLHELRRLIPGFHPPQAFRYLSAGEQADLVA